MLDEAENQVLTHADVNLIKRSGKHLKTVQIGVFLSHKLSNGAAMLLLMGSNLDQCVYIFTSSVKCQVC